MYVIASFSVACFLQLFQNRASVVQKLSYIVSLLSYTKNCHIYIFYVAFLKRYIGHTYIDLFTEIYLLRNPRFSDKHVYRHVCQDDQMTDTVQHDTTDWL